MYGCLSDAERRRNWWWTGFLTLVFTGGAVAVGLAEPTSDRWWWVGGFVVAWLASVFYVINRGYGRTLLTADGLEFRTFVSRRSIPWSEIVEIERRQHLTRGGYWWDLRAVRVRGRALTIPGAFTNRTRDAAFEQKLSVIHERWSRAVGG
ncbi:PH domain-containing protein [Streptomyces nodosus]